MLSVPLISLGILILHGTSYSTVRLLVDASRDNKATRGYNRNDYQNTARDERSQSHKIPDSVGRNDDGRQRRVSSQESRRGMQNLGYNSNDSFRDNLNYLDDDFNRNDETARSRRLPNDNYWVETKRRSENVNNPPPPPPPPPTRSSSESSLSDDHNSQVSKLQSSDGSADLSMYAGLSSSNPIHYNFPAVEVIDQQRMETTDEYNSSNKAENTRSRSSSTKVNSDIAHYDTDTLRNSRSRSVSRKDFASARTDAITKFTSTKLGKVQLTVSSAFVGSIIGTFIGKSIFGHAMPFSALFAALFVIMNMMRNDYGELSRSLGLAFIYTLGRIHKVRKRYPTGSYVKSALGFASRQPFPPFGKDENGDSISEENPWAYRPISPDDPDFDMIKSVIAMGLVGSFCGGNLPLIPTWMGSAGGAVAFVFVSIARTGKGDLARIMGMRVVSLVEEALDINAELRITRKLGIVTGKVYDKVMILDRKHKIKDRIFKGLSWIYDRASSTASQVQEDIRQRNGDTKR